MPCYASVKSFVQNLFVNKSAFSNILNIILQGLMQTQGFTFLMFTGVLDEGTAIKINKVLTK